MLLASCTPALLILLGSYIAPCTLCAYAASYRLYSCTPDTPLVLLSYAASYTPTPNTPVLLYCLLCPCTPVLLILFYAASYTPCTLNTPVLLYCLLCPCTPVLLMLSYAASYTPCTLNTPVPLYSSNVFLTCLRLAEILILAGGALRDQPALGSLLGCSVFRSRVHPCWVGGRGLLHTAATGAVRVWATTSSPANPRRLISIRTSIRIHVQNACQ